MRRYLTTTFLALIAGAALQAQLVETPRPSSRKTTSAKPRNTAAAPKPDPDGIHRLASIAFEVNERTENIGARRLSTVMERLLDDVSFDAARHEGQSVRIDRDYVDARLQALSQNEDLSRFIL